MYNLWCKLHFKTNFYPFITSTCSMHSYRDKAWKCEGTVISIFILQKHWWIRKLVFSSAGRWSYPKVTCQRLEIDSPFNKERSILGVPPLFSVMEKVYIRNNFVSRLCFHERLNDFFPLFLGLPVRRKLN